MSAEARLTGLANAWLVERERMAARHRILDVRQSEFLLKWSGYAQQLDDILPGLNLAQFEALSELFNRRLEIRRLAMQNFAQP